MCTLLPPTEMRQVLLAILIALIAAQAVSANGCDCEDDTCGCCAHLKIHEPKFEGDVCVNVTYRPKEIDASVTISIDGIVVLNETYGLQDLEKICIEVPYVHLLKLCVQFYNVSWDKENLYACVEVELEALGHTLLKYKIGCFHIHIPELVGGPKHKAPILPLGVISNAEPKPRSYNADAENGMECWMCKKLLPYVGTHECSKKCMSWWSWAQNACDYVCDELVEHMSAQHVCAAAGYCPWSG